MSTLLYPWVFACSSECAACACAQRLAGVRSLLAWRLSDQRLILLPIRSSIVVPLCPCRQCRETIASHLCNLQTSICSVSARAYPPAASAVSPGSSVAPRCVLQIVFFTSQHSFVLSACLPKPPCNLDGPSQVPFVLPV